MAVSAVHCVSSSLVALPCKLRCVSLSTSSPTSSTRPNLAALSSLSFSSNLSCDAFTHGFLSMRTTQRRIHCPFVCEAAPNKKADSAAKRMRQNEKRRLRNKARKSEIRTRMRKALEALDELKKKNGAQFEEVIPVERLIGEAYSAIDKAVVKGTLHRNTGARRKSRLARRKKAVEIHHGWYTPAPALTA